MRFKHIIKLQDDILNISKIFKHNGYQLYVVGGAVRDSYLSKRVKDYDLATDATPDVVEELMNKSGLKTLPTGKKHGVINVFTKGGEYEVSTFRTDGSYSDGRRPDNVTFTTIEEDVKRRDLTCNALFYDIEKQEIVDLVGGIYDLENSIIRTVGNPTKRFNEDKLRILRCIRFAARYNFDIHDDIKRVLLKDNVLTGVSDDRIREEFLKGLKTSYNVTIYLKLLDVFNLFGEIFGNLEINKDFKNVRNPVEQIAILLYNNDVKVVCYELKKLRYTNKEVNSIKFLLKLLKFNYTLIYDYKKLQNKTNLTKENIINFSTLIGLNVDIIGKLVNFKLTVTGDDAEKEGIIKGPEMGKWIRKKEVELFKEI